MAPTDEKEIVTLRVPRTQLDAVRQIAEREHETQAVIIRRLIRVGLERRTAEQSAR